MARITCPYCGHKQAFPRDQTTCQSCEEEIPSKYISNSRKRPPVWMVTVGYTRHGKTTYLDSLALVLENLGKISRGTFCTHLDSTTFDKLRDIRKEAQEGTLSGATQRGNRPRPLILSLPNFLDNACNTLVINDLPGEIFDKPEVADNYAEPIRQAETIWFIISLSDIFSDKEGRTIAELVQNYVDSMERLGSHPKGRRILAVYTKADRLVNRLPPTIKEYLGQDPYSKIKQMTMAEAQANLFDAFEYVDKMYRISEDLKEYTFNEVPRGADFISMIEYYGMELSFSIVASVPGADGLTTGVDTPRFRVIDPLIWSLTSQLRGTHETKCALIVDGGAGATSIFFQDLPGEFFDAIQASNLEINTYLTGQSKIETDQRPEKPPNKQRLLTIGPILDMLPGDVYALLVVDETPLDLLDYMYSSWHDRIMLVSTKDLQVQWPHKVHYVPSDMDVYDVVRDFVALISPK
ncbi:MAG: hypothetical protein D6711_16920 [Chloroflexi bacterium]|nr:MAG: hypothetical protein D6711_16920 [Chloroflexota bacterium]